MIRLSFSFPNNALSLRFSFHFSSVHDDGDNETVEAEGFSENEDEDHSNVHVFLGVGTDTGVSDNSDGESSSESGETTAHTSGEMFVSMVRSVRWGLGGVSGLNDTTEVNNGHNEAVNSEDTSHDTGNEGFEDEVVVHDSDRANTNSRFGSTIGSSEVSKHKGGGDSHESEESVLVDGSQLFVLQLLYACFIPSIGNDCTSASSR